MKKEFQKKILSVLLSISMIASQMSTVVYAADELAEETHDHAEVSVSETGDLVVEGEEISEPETEEIGENTSDTVESSDLEIENIALYVQASMVNRCHIPIIQMER